MIFILLSSIFFILHFLLLLLFSNLNYKIILYTCLFLILFYLTKLYLKYFNLFTFNLFYTCKFIFILKIILKIVYKLIYHFIILYQFNIFIICLNFINGSIDIRFYILIIITFSNFKIYQRFFLYINNKLLNLIAKQFIIF